MNITYQFNILLIVYINLLHKSYSLSAKNKEYRIRELTDHTLVSDNGLFPFMAAILLKSVYLSAGALINEYWVVTAADALYMIRESTRVMRVRLGSVNNKKDGYLYPVKSIEIHPNFDDSKPQYDIALVMLPTRVRFTPNLNPIQMQSYPKEIVATHFIVNSWPPHIIPSNIYPNHTESLDIIKRRRMLTVSHLHPSSRDNCSDLLEYLNMTAMHTVMCLDPAIGTDPCERDVGAPVVLNGILWGIMSSWKPEDCAVDPGPIVVTLLAAKNISSWLHATMMVNRRLTPPKNKIELDYENYYYYDDD